MSFSKVYQTKYTIIDSEGKYIVCSLHKDSYTRAVTANILELAGNNLLTASVLSDTSIDKMSKHLHDLTFAGSMGQLHLNAIDAAVPTEFKIAAMKTVLEFEPLSRDEILTKLHDERLEQMADKQRKFERIISKINIDKLSDNDINRLEKAIAHIAD